MNLPRLIRHALTLALFSFSFISIGQAESPAPSVHWGAIGYPENDRTLLAGLTVNRFTEFDGAGKRFNDIQETAGFNFATVSWTERLTRFRSMTFTGWTTNLTVGVGPTQDGLSRFLQNDVVHKLRELTEVPVGTKRDGTDFMLTGSLTKWKTLFGRREEGFFGIGFAGGTLYYEPFVRAGIRRLSLADMVKAFGGQDVRPIRTFSHFFRFSAMGRYGGIFESGTYRTLAPHSVLGQASISLADYRFEETFPPRWEIEVAASIDSGLFVDLQDEAIEERFVSLAITVPYVTFETWNDLINQKDYGPTFGLRLTLDLLQIYDEWIGPL